MPLVGVLALQGDVGEHVASLCALHVDVIAVRRVSDLATVDALVIPGGESTAIAHLLETSGLKPHISAVLAAGMPVLGTCAGLILLATHVIDGRSDQWSFSRLDVSVRRNGFGRQVASFETPVTLSSGVAMTGVFIRAPRIESIGDSVEVMATMLRDGQPEPVLVREGSTWGCSFHPELTERTDIHELFVRTL